MKQPSELTRDQLEDLLRQIRDILWQDPVSGAFDPDRSWTVETIEWVSGVLEDAAENELSLREGFRLLSAYGRGDRRFWVITEADRSVTTVLLPSEY